MLCAVLHPRAVAGAVLLPPPLLPLPAHLERGHVNLHFNPSNRGFNSDSGVVGMSFYFK